MSGTKHFALLDTSFPSDIPRWIEVAQCKPTERNMKGFLDLCLWYYKSTVITTHGKTVKGNELDTLRIWLGLRIGPAVGQW